ncbi:MAG: hypothetical protein EOO43_04195, partial [Flavobacterium sp.]
MYLKEVDFNRLKICISENLSSYDPYDVWKTKIGFYVKNLFNNNMVLGALPALILTLFDQLINNKLRVGYKKQEYPIVRSLAAQILIKNYIKTQNTPILSSVESHLDWLEKNSSKGFSGVCWGLGFK